MEDFLNYHGLGHFKERDDDRYLRKNEVYDIPWLVDETSSFSDDDLVLVGKITDKGMYATTVSNLLGGVDLDSISSIIGNTDISSIGDGTVTGAISTNAKNISANSESISSLSNTLSTKQDQIIYMNLSSIGLSSSTASSLLDISQALGNAKLLATVNSGDTSNLYSNGIIPVSSTGTLEVGRYNARARATYITDNSYLYIAGCSNGSSTDFSTWRGVVTSSIGSTVGSSSTPVYINGSGVATACSYAFTSYLPLSGGTLTGALTVNSTITTTGNITSGSWFIAPNGSGYYVKDTTGTNRTAISINSSNNYNIATGGIDGGDNVYIGASGTTNTLGLRGSTIAITGALTVSSTSTLTGSLTVNSTIIGTGWIETANNSGFRILDSSNNYRVAMQITSSNEYYIATGQMSNNIYIGNNSYTDTMYLRASSITASGSLTVNNNNIYLSYSSATAARIVISNSKGSARFSVDADGYPGIYDENVNDGQWVIRSHHNFLPSKDNSYSIGSGSLRWDVIHATSSTINTSDERAKTNVNDIDERYENLFMKLHPVNYMRKNFRETDNHDRVHCGLIAQEVEESCEEVGLDSMTFAALCHDELDKENYQGLTDIYGIAYGELNGLEIHMIQKCLSQIEELENKIAELESA